MLAACILDAIGIGERNLQAEAVKIISRAQ